MPTVPGSGPTGTSSASPLSGPSDNDLLMATASLHGQGKLSPEPELSMPSNGALQPNPAKPNRKRKLRVIK